MSILAYFVAEQVPIAITRPTETNVDGIRTPGTDVNVWSGNGLYWEGNAATALVSERFRDVTSAAIGIETGTGVASGDKVVAGGKTYKALDPDNIALQGEVCHVPLEVYS